MGLKSRRAFSEASPAQVLAAAKAVQAWLQHVDKPINMSLLRIPNLVDPAIAQYGVVQFIEKEKSLATTPPVVEQAFASVPFSGSAQTAFRSRLLLDPNLALAIELSRVAGRALYIVHSDSYCSSGYVVLEDARAVEGVIYGWEGDEFLFEFGPGRSVDTLLPIEQTQYWKYASLGVGLYLGTNVPYHEYLEQFDYSSSAITRYRLMLQKELIETLSPEAF